MSTQLLSECVREVDENLVGFYGDNRGRREMGPSRLELDSLVRNIWRMRRTCCFRRASKMVQLILREIRAIFSVGSFKENCCDSVTVTGLVLSSSSKYKPSVIVGTLLLPAHCSLLHYLSIFVFSISHRMLPKHWITGSTWSGLVLQSGPG